MAHWRAACDKCGHVVRERSDCGWLSNFFLPDRCPNCHDFKSQSNWTDRGWLKTYGEYVTVRKQKFSILKPSTWFGTVEWKVIE